MNPKQRHWRELLDLVDFIIGAIEVLPERDGGFLYWPVKQIEELARIAQLLEHKAPIKFPNNKSVWICNPFGKATIKALIGESQNVSMTKDMYEMRKDFYQRTRREIIGVLKQWKLVASRELRPRSNICNPPSQNKHEAVNRLPPSERNAYESYLSAMATCSTDATEDEVYDYLKEHGVKNNPEYRLPKRDTFKRYLRRARRKLKLGEQHEPS